MYALHKACMNGVIEHVQLLLDSGADIEGKTNYGKRTPLHLASLYGHIDIVRLLVDSGADIQVKDIFNCTPLYLAYQDKHEDTVRLLLDLGANIDGITSQLYARKSTIKKVLKCHEHNMIKLKEWRPWNHSKYPEKYCNTMKTLLILAKQRK